MKNLLYKANTPPSRNQTDSFINFFDNFFSLDSRAGKVYDAEAREGGPRPHGVRHSPAAGSVPEQGRPGPSSISTVSRRLFCLLRSRRRLRRDALLRVIGSTPCVTTDARVSRAAELFGF